MKLTLGGIGAGRSQEYWSSRPRLRRIFLFSLQDVSRKAAEGWKHYQRVLPWDSHRVMRIYRVALEMIGKGPKEELIDDTAAD